MQGRTFQFLRWSRAKRRGLKTQARTCCSLRKQGVIERVDHNGRTVVKWLGIEKQTIRWLIIFIIQHTLLSTYKCLRDSKIFFFFYFRTHVNYSFKMNQRLLSFPRSVFSTDLMVSWSGPSSPLHYTMVFNLGLCKSQSTYWRYFPTSTLGWCCAGRLNEDQEPVLLQNAWGFLHFSMLLQPIFMHFETSLLTYLMFWKLLFVSEFILGFILKLFPVYLKAD